MGSRVEPRESRLTLSYPPDGGEGGRDKESKGKEERLGRREGGRAGAS